MQTPTPAASEKTGSSRFCWICGKVISLETCKTDDHGNMVHEFCYAMRIKLQQSMSLKHNQFPQR